MTDEDFRHKLSDEQKAMSEKQLAATLRPGQALSVRRRGPWDVCLTHAGTWIVTDCSTGPDRRPVKVHQAATRTEAEAVVSLFYLLWSAMKHQVPERGL